MQYNDTATLSDDTAHATSSCEHDTATASPNAAEPIEEPNTTYRHSNQLTTTGPQLSQVLSDEYERKPVEWQRDAANWTELG